MIILLDNGHGCDTKGKRSPDGRLLEYRYNRDRVRNIELKLAKRGYNAISIVPEETDVPLKERTKRVNGYVQSAGKDKVLLVSVHCNAAGMGDKWLNASFWSVWTCKGQTESDVIADVVADEAIKQLKPLGKRVAMQKACDGDADYEENFYILYHTKCPAILVENFFMDNKNDVDWLLSDEGKETVENIIVEGLINYITKYKQG